MSSGCWRRVIATNFGRRGVEREQQDRTDRRQKGNMSNRAITGCSRSWFFSFSSVASPKTGRSEYDNLFPGEHLHLRRPLSGKTPRGMRLAFRSGPLPCCRMKRSVMCHLSGIIGMIKYEFIPARVQNEKYLIYLYPKGYKS